MSALNVAVVLHRLSLRLVCHCICVYLCVWFVIPSVAKESTTVES